MEYPVFSVSLSVLSAFFEAAEGNYRNSIYVTCSCNHVMERSCRDFLVAPGHDCKPIIVPVADAEKFLGIPVDKSECVVRMGSHTFMRLYHKWIVWVTESDTDCPMQLLRSIERENGK